MQLPVTFGVIGLGRWGRNYLKTLADIGMNVKWGCSTSEETIKSAVLYAKQMPKTTMNYKDILDDRQVEAVAIVTPGSTHYALAKEALERNLHVIVEKPLAFEASKVEELFNLAKERKKVLMVSDIHYFNPGIAKLKTDMGRGVFGKVTFMNMVHGGAGPVRTDMNALWDYHPHSVSMILNVLEKKPLSVSATGAQLISKGVEDIVTINMQFKDSFAIATGTWLYPYKKMELVVSGSKMGASYDDFGEAKLRYFTPDQTIIQQFEPTLPLTNMLNHFVFSVQKKRIQEGRHTIAITKVLESAQKSLKSEGKVVEIKL